MHANFTQGLAKLEHNNNSVNTSNDKYCDSFCFALQYKSALVAEFSQQILSHFASGQLKPVIDSVFPLERVQDAHMKMEQNLNTGKILLQVLEDAQQKYGTEKLEL